MKNFFNAAVVLGILNGLLFPAVQFINPSIPYLIGIMLVLNFLDIKTYWKDLLRKELFLTSFLTIIFIPVISYYILSIPFEENIRIGILLTACAPAGIMTLIIARFIPQKDYNLIFSNFLFTTFASIIYIPYLLKLIIGRNVEINSLEILIQIAVLILIPYSISRILLKFVSDIKLNKVRFSTKFILPLLVFVIISGSIGGASEELEWNRSLILQTAVIALIYALHGIIGYFSGYIFGGKDIRHSLALTTTSRNIQIMLAVTILNFDSVVLIPLVIAIIIHHFSNAVILYLFRE
ncbi:hypothetical protein ACFL5P_00785 [candidate division KSB1 bacterium]